MQSRKTARLLEHRDCFIHRSCVIDNVEAMHPGSDHTIGVSRLAFEEVKWYRTCVLKIIQMLVIVNWQSLLSLDKES